jgi:DNA-binding transcriptional regulator of glucitol operon
VDYVRRILLSPKWWGLHLLCIFLVVLFLRLGLWQWHRAQSPSGGIQNYAYAFQWPLFAVFGIVLYWKTLQIELAGETDESGESPRPLSGPLAGLAAKPLPELKIEHQRGADGRPSVRVGISTSLPTPDEDDEEVATYNAYLARLNARSSAVAPRSSQSG